MFEKLILYIDSFFWLTTRRVIEVRTIEVLPDDDGLIVVPAEVDAAVPTPENADTVEPEVEMASDNREELRVTREEHHITVGNDRIRIPKDVQDIAPLFVDGKLNATSFPSSRFFNTFSMVATPPGKLLYQHDGVAASRPNGKKLISMLAGRAQQIVSENVPNEKRSRSSTQYVDLRIYVAVNTIFVHGDWDDGVGITISQPLLTQINGVSEAVVWGHSYARMMLLLAHQYGKYDVRNIDETALADNFIAMLYSLIDTIDPE